MRYFTDYDKDVCYFAVPEEHESGKTHIIWSDGDMREFDIPLSNFMKSTYTELSFVPSAEPIALRSIEGFKFHLRCFSYE